MISSHNSFGLYGQTTVEEYDNFLCFSKKCKDRKAERHRERIARKKAKTDSMKADTERVRAETDIVTQVPAAPAAPNPIIQTAPPQTPPPAAPAKAGMGIVPVLLLGGLLVGGLLFMKKGKAEPATA